MESIDNKTPNKPASGRPSLLGPSASPAAEPLAQTRILASLEREGTIPGIVFSRERPSRRKYGLAALALVALGGAAAFLALKPADDASTRVAASPAPLAERPASGAVVAASPAVPPSAAAPNTAARIELAAVAQAGPDSQAHANPLDKLALDDTTSAASAPASAVPRSAPPHPVAAARPRNKDATRAKTRAETVAAVHAEPRAGARKTHKPEDDADTDLVAAIIARLDKRGAQPGAAAPTAVGESAAAGIAGKVRQCSANSDLVEARQCRNRACEGYWGKVDACPAARAPRSSLGEGSGDGWRG